MKILFLILFSSQIMEISSNQTFPGLLNDLDIFKLFKIRLKSAT